MKLKLLSLLFVMAVSVQAWSPEQAELIRRTVRATPAPELSVTASKLIKAAKPADRAQVVAVIIKTVKEHRPSALKAVEDVIPAENRPVTTPGTEHGNRPPEPPGLHNYGKP